MYMNFYLIFFLQMMEAVKGLQQIYARDELEATALSKIALDAMHLQSQNWQHEEDKADNKRQHGGGRIQEMVSTIVMY